MSPVKRLLAFVLTMLVAVALGACGAKLSDQKGTVINGEGFSAKMPGKPTRMVRTVQTSAGPVQLTAYISHADQEAFSISEERIPQGSPFNLDGAVRGEVAGVHGTLQNVTAITYQHFPGRDARLTALSNGSPGTVFERTILANGEAFDLQFVEGGSDVKTPPASYATFLASLKIT